MAAWVGNVCLSAEDLIYPTHQNELIGWTIHRRKTIQKSEQESKDIQMQEEPI